MFKACILFFGICSVSFAFDKANCSHGGVERSVEIKKGSVGSSPCRVIYLKEKGDPIELWKAENDFNFCEEKAQGFVAKLKDLGWDCK